MFNFKNKTETNNQNLFHEFQQSEFQQSMDQNGGFYDISNNKPLWNPKSFTMLSVLFSFLPAAIMYSINYRRLGYQKKGKKLIIIYIIGFIATILLYSMLPGMLGKYLAMGVNGGIGASMMKEQLPLFEEHISRGGKKASLVTPIILCVILTAILLIPIIYARNIPESKLTFSGDEIYYNSNVKELEIENLGQYLIEYGFFQNDNNTISLKLDKGTNELYIVSVIVDKESLNNSEMLEAFTTFAQDISKDVFKNAKVEIHLCDDRFNKLKVVNP